MAHEHEEHFHSHVKLYVFMAIILGIATGIEVSVLMWPDWFGWEPGSMSGFLLFSLYFLAVIKFVLVVAYFMHLYFDNNLLTGFFASGLIVAFGTMIAMIALIGYQPSLQESFARAKEAQSVKKGDPKVGMKVFESKGCIACHKIAFMPSAVGAVGPALDGLGERAGSRVEGLNAEAYLKQSIENPAAFLVESYGNLMTPGLKDSMSAQEYSDLIAFLGSLKEGATADNYK